eukprot:TRINITY_DN6685_c0_g1_i1.p2 TRINITY_DN6685_c0_g1~~TRINITY_DN6685_c0_g1_i1.p2  ORF type:complete len:112 (-),score=27.20 TRINITY_DN6685_c0_g1_i1:142-477(-)
MSSDHDVVKAFYDYWTPFSTKRSFGWKDKWKLSEAPNRRIRRAMEAENRKERAEAKKEYNGVVKRLIQLVRKRDPRVAMYQKEVKERRIAQEEAENERKKQVEDRKTKEDV